MLQQDVLDMESDLIFNSYMPNPCFPRPQNTFFLVLKY